MKKNESYSKLICKIINELEEMRDRIESEPFHPIIISLTVLVVDKILAFFDLLKALFESINNDMPLNEYNKIMNNVSNLINRLKNEI